LDDRIAFYEADDRTVPQINADTARLQTELWSAVRGPATKTPTPVNALVLAGMNDVLNSQGYTQAAWWNRIPISAWVLMAIIAICSNLLVGYGSHRTKGRTIVLLVVPLLASFAFLLIADLDSPRGGLIHVTPQNLESLAQSLPAP
jgi:lipopolysaccharide export LptBFGC system permease protein LptF